MFVGADFHCSRGACPRRQWKPDFGEPVWTRERFGGGNTRVTHGGRGLGQGPGVDPYRLLYPGRAPASSRPRRPLTSVPSGAASTGPCPRDCRVAGAVPLALRGNVGTKLGRPLCPGPGVQSAPQTPGPSPFGGCRYRTLPARLPCRGHRPSGPEGQCRPETGQLGRETGQAEPRAAPHLAGPQSLRGLQVQDPARATAVSRAPSQGS